MKLVRLTDNVCMVQWDGEGRFNKQFIADFNQLLDTILSDENIKVLITTGTGKIYSNGLDLQEIIKDADLPPHEFLNQYYLPMLARFLTLPVVTVASVQGHAFAGGMVLALAHDIVVMNGEKGYLSMNEILLPGPIPIGMAEVVRARMPNLRTTMDCMLLAKRFTGTEAYELGIVDSITNLEELQDMAVKMGIAYLKTYNNRLVVASIKEKIHTRALYALTEKEPASSFSHVNSKI